MTCATIADQQNWGRMQCATYLEKTDPCNRKGALMIGLQQHGSYEVLVLLMCLAQSVGGPRCMLLLCASMKNACITTAAFE